MLRFAALAALAAVATAAPAYAADTIHVSTVGKTPEQVNAEVQTAAARLCQSRNDGLGFYQRTPCVRATVREALARANAPAPDKLAAR